MVGTQLQVVRIVVPAIAAGTFLMVRVLKSGTYPHEDERGVLGGARQPCCLEGLRLRCSASRETRKGNYLF